LLYTDKDLNEFVSFFLNVIAPEKSNVKRNKQEINQVEHENKKQEQ
jgi:hypothetical protein